MLDFARESKKRRVCFALNVFRIVAGPRTSAGESSGNAGTKQANPKIPVIGFANCRLRSDVWNSAGALVKSKLLKKSLL